MRDKVRIGLVGAGEMGGIHLRLLQAHPAAELVGVCDADAGVRDRVEREYSMRTYADYRALIEEGRPDAVIIATPPHLHPEQALYALNAGLYVLLEKPLAVKLEDAERVHEAAGGRLMMAFSLRFHGLYRRIAESLDSLGRVVFQWHLALGRMPSNSWVGLREKSGGMINEHAVHMLYVFLWYAGEVEAVHARLRRLGEKRDIEDTAAVELVHGNGATSILLQTWWAGHRLRGWGIQCEEGTVTVEGYLGGPYRISRTDTGTIEEGVFEEPVEEMYRRQLDHFLDCVIRGKRPEVNEEDGLRIQRLVAAIHRSAAEGRPVRVDDPPKGK
ncbi:Gfo/Idh/MocA family protein [Candidatus Bipolaricaulota sp. J31]